MKKILLIFLLFFSIHYSHSQCAGTYVNNYGARYCNTTDSMSNFLYNASIYSISPNQIVIQNFTGATQYFNDTIVANIDCTTDSLFIIPITYHVAGYPLSWTGSGKIYADSININYTHIYPAGTSQYCITYVKGIIVNVKENILKPSHFKIWPNPIRDVLNITTDLQNVHQISIVDLNGKKVHTVENSNKTIDVSHLAKGMYVLKVITQDGLMISEKFVKH